MECTITSYLGDWVSCRLGICTTDRFTSKYQNNQCRTDACARILVLGGGGEGVSELNLGHISTCGELYIISVGCGMSGNS